MTGQPRRHNAGWPSVLWLGIWLGIWAASPAAAGRLDDATSPYLLKHAKDAIEWRPWGEAALAEARREDKPIFLSIGYAACHWCHVMARKTFSDPRVIEILNEQFISILVDREERPDLDHHFMAVMSGMLGFSGSPANFFLMPDGTPLFAAGYMSPEAEYGKRGFVAVLRVMTKEWTGNRTGLLADAKEIRQQMRAMSAPVPTGPAQAGAAPRETAAQAWSAKFDRTHGGFGQGAKFLRPNVLSLLLHHGIRRGDKALLENVYRTLDRMAAGGVRDQLGGAFHRYAVDRFWRIPHFEIMLNENALLARLYLEAYQASAKPRFKAVARAILDDLLARFRLPAGGFASALDSESDGKDGSYYTWSMAELKFVLDTQEVALFIAAYFEGTPGTSAGRNVLRFRGKPEHLPATEERLRDARRKLIAARAKRDPPFRDDKILTSWNALAVGAFAKAAQVLDDDRYRRVAAEAVRRLLAANTGRLVHSRRAGKTNGDVFLDDYAFLIEALLDLYETDFDIRHLNDARRLTKTVIGRFQTKPGSPFRFTPVGSVTGIPAKIILEEENVPSGNAAALIALHRLALFGGGAELERQARDILTGLGRYLDSSAPFATGLLRALYYRPDEAREIVIVGRPEDSRTRRLLAEIRKRPLIGTVLAVIAPDAPRENKAWPLLAGRPLLNDAPTAYVCKNRICNLPVDTPEALAAQLDRLLAQRF